MKTVKRIHIFKSNINVWLQIALLQFHDFFNDFLKRIKTKNSQQVHCTYPLGITNMDPPYLPTNYIELATFTHAAPFSPSQYIIDAEYVE